MIKRAVLASAFAVGVMAAPAAAQDWTGFYIGLHVGGAFGDTEWTNVTNGSVGEIDFAPGQSFDHEPDGVLGGAQIGYNFQMTNWLFGLEVTGAGLDYDETTLNPNAPDVEITTSEIEWLATAAARVGWTWQECLLYLKGGYATGNLQTTHVDPPGGDANAYATDETHHGWVGGAGFEHQIGERASVGIEYNYIDLGEQDHTGVLTGGGTTVVNDMDVQIHTVTARLNWALWAP
jgi:outer membrane immunogenic protein